MNAYDSKTLFLICALCEGTGVLPEELASMGKCVCNGSGYISSGLTTSQFDLYKQRAEAAPEMRRTLEKIQKIAEEAISRGNEAWVDEEFIDIQRAADECLSQIE